MPKLESTSFYANVDGKTTEGRVKLIAFYLTQFHPIPENDLWWGRGFTEWTNVTKAVPLFRGHYQPHLPADFGFYDLRVGETRRDQIAMAKSYGIDGFCYYYYWFSGHKLLERPLEDMLADKASDMPFCLCWANENWTRRWDAAEHEILIAQHYAPDDDLNFIKSLVPYFRDPRYIRVEGAPLLIVYRPQHLPDAKKSAEVWRDYCRSIGIPELNIFCAFTHQNWDYEQFGFDGGVEFPPHNMKQQNLRDQLDCIDGYEGYVFDCTEVAEMYLARDYRAMNGFRAVFPSWDNSARRSMIGSAGLNGTPENYEYWLSRAIARTKADYPDDERLVFINAWNEWAEGCHLEPDRKYGHKFLEATARAKAGQSACTGWTHVGVPTGLKRLPIAAAEPAPASKARRLLNQASARFKPRVMVERDALRTQRDFAVVQRDEAIALRDLLIAQRDEFMGQRDALLAQRDALTVQSGLLALQRDDLVVQVASLAGAAAARDRLAAQLAALAGGEGASGLATLAERLEDLRARYLDLMESVLIGTASDDPPSSTFGQQQFDPKIRQRGLDWPSHALSMIGAARMRNFRVLLEQVIGDGITGDIVETGVWRGGASILARAVLAAYGVKDRKVILADSFEGLPPPDPRRYPADEGSTFHQYAELAVSDEAVRRNFEKFGLFDNQVVLVKGWFKTTMANVPSNRIAILRLDGDLYESTIIPLKYLFDKVPAGGFVIVDDYECVPACKLAVDDFLAERALKPDIRHIDGVGVFFQKTGS